MGIGHLAANTKSPLIVLTSMHGDTVWLVCLPKSQSSRMIETELEADQCTGLWESKHRSILANLMDLLSDMVMLNH